MEVIGWVGTALIIIAYYPHIAMFEEFDLQALRRVPQFAHYFRYPLRHQDFHEASEQGRLLGHIAAKPLYGRLTVAGQG